MANELGLEPRTYVPPRSRVERFLCRMLFRAMLNTKRIEVDFGDAEANRGKGFDPEFVVAPPRLWTTIKMMVAPNLWVGEAFISGEWYLKKGSLSDFLYAITQDANTLFKTYYEVMSFARGARFWLRQYILNHYYTRRVKQHYDLDSKIYEKILDSEMLYTCAFFLSEHDTLETAQQNKIVAVIERMAVPPRGGRVLDIGCGWGGIARAIVKRYENAEVCGLSISSGQLDWSKQKDANCLSAQQASRIEYRSEDYVDHKKYSYYDAISVVGMIEHVGLGGYAEFFSHVHGFLKPGGRAVIHTIVSPSSATPTNRWIDKHIFSGGYTPSVSELTKAVERHPFRISGLHVYSPMHYRKTIECWIANLQANASDLNDYLLTVKYTKHDIGRFMRTWMFYLSAVRNMFRGDNEGSHQVVQLSIQRLGG